MVEEIKKEVEETKKSEKSDDVLVVEHLVKTYDKKILAVNDVSFRIPRGVTFSLLGTNGAGKSTILNIVATILEKDSGDIYLLGEHSDSSNLKNVKNKIGVIFQDCCLDQELSGEKNLYLRGSFYGLKKRQIKERINFLSGFLGINDFLKKPLKNLSGGQRRKIDITRALIHQPELLIVDEMTTGLDPRSRQLTWNVLNNLKDKLNLTIFSTTHYLEEAETSEIVAIMNKGKIVAIGSPNDLKNQFHCNYVVLKNVSDSLLEQMKQDCLFFNFNDTSRECHVFFQSEKELKEYILRYDNIWKDFSIVNGTMRDLFLAATGGIEGEME